MPEYLSLNVEDHASERPQSIPFDKSYSRCVNSISVRLAGSNDPCEDRYALRSCAANNIQAFAVFDGHGGFLAADIATSMLLDILLGHVNSLSSKDRTAPNIAKVLDKTFLETDELILNEAIRIHKHRQNNAGSTCVENCKVSNLKPTGRAGTCALVMLVVDGVMYFAHTGDCRAAICTTLPTAAVQLQRATPDSQQNHTFFFEPPSEKVGERSDSDTSESSQNGDVSSNKTLLGDENGQYHVEFAMVDHFLDDTALALSVKDKATGYPASTRATTLHKRKREEGISSFTATATGSNLVLRGITEDHICSVAAEAAAISCMSDDAMPIRRTVLQQRGVPLHAPLRVGGSLVVTRALGDGYLKMKELSVEPFVSHCPYISCRPTISWRKVQPTDRAVILASDGLWNFMSAKDCVNAMLSFEKDAGLVDMKAACVLPANCRFESHVPTAESKDGGSGYVPNPVNIQDAFASPASMELGTVRVASRTGLEHHGEDSVFTVCAKGNSSALDAKPDGEHGDPRTAQTATTTNRSHCKSRDLDKEMHNPVKDETIINMDAAGTLLDTCLRTAALNAKTNVDRLRSMQAGSSRRELVDDITVMVLYF